MKKIDIKTWIGREFEEGAGPDERTVRRWCENGTVPAVKIGGSWYIYAELAQQTTGNDLVDQVLRA